MAVAVDHDYAVVDVAEDGQHRNVRIGQSMLQAMALNRVLEDRLLTFNRNVVDADVRLRARAYGGDAAMFTILGRQRDDRMLPQRADQFGE